MSSIAFRGTSPERARGSVILSRLSRDGRARGRAKPREPALQAAPRARGARRRRRRRRACSRGPKLVLEALAAGLRVVEAAAGAAGRETPRRAARPRGPRRARRAVRRLERRAARLALRGGDRTGTARRRRAARRSTRSGSSRGTPLVLVADAVQNPGNLGGLLRTAEAAGASGRVPDRRHAPTRSRGRRCAARWAARSGSPTRAARTIDAVLDALERRGVRVRRDGGRRRAPLRRGRPARAGGGRGRRRGRRAAAGGAVARAAARLRVPLRPPVESLNVGVAAALVLFEAARQRGFAGGRRPR